MIRARRSMYSICFHIHRVIFIWAMPRHMRSVMLLLVIGFKKVLTSCTQLVGMPLVYLLKMLPLSAMKIHVSGPTKTLQHRNLQCVATPVPSIGIASLTPATLSTTSGTSGSLPNCMTVAWPIAKTLQLTGAQVARQYWPTNK